MKGRRATWLLGGAVIVVALALGLYFGLRDTGESEPLIVSIPTYPGGGVLFIAQEKGYFGDLQVEIQIIDDWRARNSAYQGGQIDVLYGTVDGFAFEAAELRPGNLLFATSYSNGADGIVAKTDVRTVHDLAGKRIAFAEGTTAHFFLAHLLREVGLSLSDITPATVDDSSLAGQAFLAGNVDAAVTWEPFVSMAAETEDGHVVVSSADKEALIIDVFYASDEAYADRRDDLVTFAQACLRAIDDIIADPQASYAAISEGLDLPLEDTGAMLSVVALQDRAGNRQLFGIGSSRRSLVEAVFDEAGDIWESVGIVTTPLSASDVIDEEFLEGLFD